MAISQPAIIGGGGGGSERLLGMMIQQQQYQSSQNESIRRYEETKATAQKQYEDAVAANEQAAQARMQQAEIQKYEDVWQRGLKFSDSISQSPQGLEQMLQAGQVTGKFVGAEPGTEGQLLKNYMFGSNKEALEKDKFGNTVTQKDEDQDLAERKFAFDQMKFWDDKKDSDPMKRLGISQKIFVESFNEKMKEVLSLKETARRSKAKKLGLQDDLAEYNKIVKSVGMEGFNLDSEGRSGFLWLKPGKVGVTVGTKGAFVEPKLGKSTLDHHMKSLRAGGSKAKATRKMMKDKYPDQLATLEAALEAEGAPIPLRPRLNNTLQNEQTGLDYWADLNKQANILP